MNSLFKTSPSFVLSILGMLALALAAGVGLLMLSAGDEQMAGQKLGQAVETVQEETQHAARNGLNEMASAIEDVSITASVKAKLAQDPELNALHIDVDTTGGRVVMRGSAPSAAARDRATGLARAVPGVTQVDTRLVVIR